MENWMDISRVDTQKSRLERICWPYDKYPKLPQLMAGSEVVLLDAEGPGVVTNIHAAHMNVLDGVIDVKSAGDPQAAKSIQIEITYDGKDRPDISMPFYDFLGDPDGSCDYFHTVYVSKVPVSHNFRLPMPFKKHIRIVLKNPTDTHVISYTEAQWKKLESLPNDVGYLHACYNRGTFTAPEEIPLLADVCGPATLKAHWLKLSTDDKHAWNGEFICEANQEFYVDGEASPCLEYLGTEDLYGHSWGLGSASSDGYSVILPSHPTDIRTDIFMLRCRTIDSIGFTQSLRLKMDYSSDYFSKDSTNPLHKQGTFANRERLSFDIDYKSCLYYYQQQ